MTYVGHTDGVSTEVCKMSKNATHTDTRTGTPTHTHRGTHTHTRTGTPTHTYTHTHAHTHTKERKKATKILTSDVGRTNEVSKEGCKMS